MNIQQRLTQLERAIAPAKDNREPLLVKFLGVDNDEPDPDRLAGILYIYDGVPASEYRLNPEQLAEYEASERNGTTEKWLNTVPRPKTIEVMNV